VVEDTPAAKSQHDDDDDDDVETPVIGRSPAHLLPLPSGLCAVAGLHRRNSYAGSLEDVLAPPPASCRPHVRRTLAVADWLAGVHAEHDDGDSRSGQVDEDALRTDESGVSRWSSADHGFVSGLMTESAELDASRLALTYRAASAVPPPLDDSLDAHLLDGLRRRRMSTPCSADEAAGSRWRCRRRRRHSEASSAAGSAAASSDYEYRESLCSKGVSVDLGEDLDGIVTPPSARPPGARVTVAGMETLHQALRQIQRDVDEMNRKFDGLRSSSAAVETASWSAVGKSHTPGDIELLEQEDEDLSSSERQQSDYIWDYRSDLVPDGAGHQFVALRPVVPSSSGNFVLHQTSLPRNYSDLGTEASIGCGTDDGMGDLYIDDDFGGTDDAVGEWASEKFETKSQLLCNVLFKDTLEATLLPDTVPLSSHSTQVYNCSSSDFSCGSCCHHPTSCGHSDSCFVTVKRHCPSHCDLSPLQTRRSSITNHPCCHHHPNHVCHSRPCPNSHLPCCCRHGDDCSHHCNVAAVKLSSRHIEERDCCNNTPRTSTPADEMPLSPDHCNNFHSLTNTNNIASQSIAETRPVGKKQDISKVIERTFSGCIALWQVCLS